MEVNLAPIAVFTYKRLDTLKQAIEALAKSDLADQSRLFIFSDGAKSSKDEAAVTEVRNYLKSVSGFKTIELNFAERNQGLAKSIIGGVTKVLEECDSIIVLEDDLVVSENFLVYMNDALNYYKTNQKVFSIAGYSVPVVNEPGYGYDVYFTPRAASWGWGSWKDRWTGIDWEVSDFEEFKKDKKRIKEFNKGGSDMFNMLSKKMQGKIDSWAIRWCYHQFKENKITAYPIVSKVRNIGFSENATNTNVYNRYVTVADDGTKTSFKFPANPDLSSAAYKQFVKFYSIQSRIKGRLMTLLQKIGLKFNN